MVEIDSLLIGNFVKLFLLSDYDNPHPTPPFHYEMWDLCCSKDPEIGIAAPRGSSKSTAITHAYILTSLLFRTKSFVLLVSDTEGQATMFLNDLKLTLQDNEAIKEQFGVKRFSKDSETDIIVEMNDGHKFRVIAKGSEQKVRGLK